MSYYKFISECRALRIPEKLAFIRIERRGDVGKAIASGLHSVVFVFGGTVRMIINGLQCSFVAGDVVNIMPTYSFCFLDISEGTNACQLLMTDDFMRDIFKSGPPYPMAYLSKLIIEPQTPFKLSDTERFSGLLDQLENIIVRRDHHFYEDLVMCGLRMLLIELGNEVFNSPFGTENGKDSDIKKELLSRFMELLDKNVSQHHTVNYFASELCVSPQYLERVVKSLTHNGVKHWIQRTLISKVNKQLNGTRKSVQQISEAFGFSDQQTFSKYYKRVMGMTPTEYRRSAKI
jgi:AraC family transcriptional activator of pobA